MTAAAPRAVLYADRVLHGRKTVRWRVRRTSSLGLHQSTTRSWGTPISATPVRGRRREVWVLYPRWGSSCQLLLLQRGRSRCPAPQEPPEWRPLRRTVGTSRSRGGCQGRTRWDLGQRQPERVMEDVGMARCSGGRRRKPCSIEADPLVVDGPEFVGCCRPVRLEQDDEERELSAAPRFGVAGVDGYPMEPRLEPVRGFAQGGGAPATPGRGPPGPHPRQGSHRAGLDGR